MITVARRAGWRWLLAAGKLALGATLLVWLVLEAEPDRIVAVLRQGTKGLVLVGAAGLAFAVLLQAVRLLLLARPWVRDFRESLEITLASLFFNQFLPGGLGGETYRVARLRGASERWSVALGLVAVERVIGAAVVLVPAVACLFFIPIRWTAPPTASRWSTVILVVAVAGCILALAAMLVRRSRGAVMRLVGTLRCLSAVTYLRVAGVSVMYHAVRLVSFLVMLEALGQRVPIGGLVIVLALSLLVSMLPLSPGSLGVKEGTLAFGLGLFGVDGATGLAVALVNRAVLLACSLLGAAVLYRGWRVPAASPAPRSEDAASVAGTKT